MIEIQDETELTIEAKEAKTSMKKKLNWTRLKRFFICVLFGFDEQNHLLKKVSIKYSI